MPYLLKATHCCRAKVDSCMERQIVQNCFFEQDGNTVDGRLAK